MTDIIFELSKLINDFNKFAHDNRENTYSKK